MGILRIVSRSDEPFRDRSEAGEILSGHLMHFRGSNAVVLGVPRGGLVVGQAIARALEADLDIVLAHKLRTPGHPELAIGSVSEDGRLFLNENLVRELGVRKEYLEEEKARQMAENARRIEIVRKTVPKVPLADRTVIVTDDGIATGATMQAALWAASQERPERLIAALPVGPEDTLVRLSEDAHEIICLRSPLFFVAIGQFYTRFDQVTDDQVISILQEERQKTIRQ